MDVVRPPEAAGSSGRLVNGVDAAESASADARPIPSHLGIAIPYQDQLDPVVLEAATAVSHSNNLPPPPLPLQQQQPQQGQQKATEQQQHSQQTMMMQVAEPAAQQVSAEPEALRRLDGKQSRQPEMGGTAGAAVKQPRLNGKQSRQPDVGSTAGAAVKQPRLNGKQTLIQDAEGDEEEFKQQASRLGAGGQKNDLLMIVVPLITSLYN